MNKIVWKAWAPSKVKNHTWLALQYSFWTAHRLMRRGGENCGLCPFANKPRRTTTTYSFHCRFTTRIWELLKDLLGIQGVFPRQWAGLNIQE
jgi:hypothetical protein